MMSAQQQPRVSLEEVVWRRRRRIRRERLLEKCAGEADFFGGVSEVEGWALLYHTVLAIQHLLLNGKEETGQIDGIELTARGRVHLTMSSMSICSLGNSTALPVESGGGTVITSLVSDTHREKMWIYSMGRSLKSVLNFEECSSTLSSVVNAMLSPIIDTRPSLLDLLDVISEYCKSRTCTKPFAHILMDMYASAAIDSQIDNWDICRPTDKSRSLLYSSSNVNANSTVHHPCGRDATLVEDKTTTSCKRSLVSSLSKTSESGVRVGSRLYRQGANPATDFCSPTTILGPEFIVRALHPPRTVRLPNSSLQKSSNLRKVVVILLNGQKLDITCDPNSTTVANIFQSVVESEDLECHVTFGLAVLSGEDFVFPPPECRLNKLVPTGWWPSASSSSDVCLNPKSKTFQLYLRFKLYLPSLRGIRWWKWKHLLYLQLRRCLLERQIGCNKNEMKALAALALQAEFGDYSVQDHGADYFLTEHYLPEDVAGAESSTSQELITLHKQRRGLDPGRAEQMFISHVMSNPDYGNHYHSAAIVNKDGGGMGGQSTIQVWLAVNSKGLTVCDKLSQMQWKEQKQCSEEATSPRTPNLSFLWKDIKKLSYSKQNFEVSTTDNNKYKFNMENNKSFYLFRLACFHHKFFAKLSSEFTSLQKLEDEFGVAMKKEEKRTPTKTMVYMSTGGCGGGIGNGGDVVGQPAGRSAAGNMLRRATSLLVSPEKGAIFRGKTATHCAVRSESCRETRSCLLWSEDVITTTATSSSNNVCSAPVTSSNTSTRSTGMPYIINTLGSTVSSCTSTVSSRSRRVVGFATAASDCDTGSHMNPNTTGSGVCQQQSGVGLLRSTSSGSSTGGSTGSSSVCGGQRRGVLMGTKAIYSNSQHDLRSASYQCDSGTSTNNTTVISHMQPPPDPTPLPSPLPDVYVVNTSIKSVDDRYHLNFQESISESLAEKFDKIVTSDSDRILTTVRLKRNIHGGLGLQVVEGKGGGVYIQSVLTGGPAAKSGIINIGDQIQAVDGLNVLSIPYTEVLKMIHSKSDTVELVLSQANKGHPKHSTPIQQPSSYDNTHLVNYKNIEKQGGMDLLANILQKPIEESYMKVIRYETETEVDYNENDSGPAIGKSVNSQQLVPLSYI